MVVLDRVFFVWETKNVVAGHVRQVVVLDSNNCMEICLGRLSIGRLIEAVVCAGLTVVRYKSGIKFLK